MQMGKRLREIIGDRMGADLVEYNLEKAVQEARDRASEPQTKFYDPLSMFITGDWLRRTGVTLGYDEMRRMAINPIVASVVTTLVNQIAAFCVPQKAKYDYGFKISCTKGKGKTAFMNELSQFMLTAGVPGYGDSNLETFARKFMRDSLILDQACAEVVPARNKQPAYWVAVDGGTIRRLKASLTYTVPPANVPYYVQVINEQIQTQYTYDRLIFGVRNPQTDINYLGYGQSEMEILMRTITAILNAERYNTSQLAQGGTQKGVLIVKGRVGDRVSFNLFKKDFREAIRAAANHWTPPVLNVGEKTTVDWVAIDRANKDIEYAQLFDFLVKQVCGVYQMAPEEINWTIGNQGASVNFESNQGPKIIFSQRRGLKPKLVFLSEKLNTHVVSRIDPDYRLEFVGLEADRKEDTDVRKSEVQNYKTVNEIRDEMGLKPLPGGDRILSPQWQGEGAPSQAGFGATPEKQDNFEMTDEEWEKLEAEMAQA